MIGGVVARKESRFAFESFFDRKGGNVLRVHFDFETRPCEGLGEFAPFAQKLDAIQPSQPALFENPVLALEKWQRVFDHVVEHFERATVLTARSALADALVQGGFGVSNYFLHKQVQL